MLFGGGFRVSGVGFGAKMHRFRPGLLVRG